MELDTRLFSFIEPTKEISIATIDKRVKLKLDIGDYQRRLLVNKKPAHAVLCYNKRKKEFYIHNSYNN